MAPLTLRDCPVVSADLVEFLDKVIPAKNFSPSDSVAAIQYYCGQRAVIDLLRKTIKLNADRLAKGYILEATR